MGMLKPLIGSGLFSKVYFFDEERKNQFIKENNINIYIINERK